MEVVMESPVCLEALIQCYAIPLGVFELSRKPLCQLNGKVGCLEYITEVFVGLLPEGFLGRKRKAYCQLASQLSSVDSMTVCALLMKYRDTCAWMYRDLKDRVVTLLTLPRKDSVPRLWETVASLLSDWF